MRRIERQGEGLALAAEALRLAPGRPSGRQRRGVEQRIGDLAARVRESLTGGDGSARRTLEALSRVLFEEEGVTGALALDDPRSLSLPFLLDEKKGTCLGLVILYLAVAERLGLDVHAAATPTHLFVRYEGPEGVLNVETLEKGRFLEDGTYRSRHRMAEESIARRIFMKPLPKRALLAHVLNNRAVIAAAAGRRRRAMRDFGAALALHPDLVAAWYNRGLEHLKAKEYEEARSDLTRAIDLHPLDAQAFNNRGLACLKTGDGEAARRDFEEALRIEPAMREAAQNLRLLEVAPAQAPAP